jgi:predicted DNA-binding ribbon-helix-helix protein
MKTNDAQMIAEIAAGRTLFGKLASQLRDRLYCIRYFLWHDMFILAKTA